MSNARHAATATVRPRSQSWISVFLEEFKRVILRTRSLVALGVFALSAIGVTIGLTKMIEWGQQQEEIGAELAGQSFVGFGAAVSVLTFALGLMCASSTARDYGDGASAATLVVVPKRSRLLSARLALWLLTALAVSLVALVPLALIYLPQFAHPSDAVIDGAFSVLGACTLTAVGFAAATLVRRGAPAVLGFLGIDFFLPTVISVASGFAPEGMQGLFTSVSRAFPGEAAQTVTNASSLLTDDLGTLVFGAVTLVVWLVVSVLVARVGFERYRGASD